jgi:hypothetical protein
LQRQQQRSAEVTVGTAAAEVSRQIDIPSELVGWLVRHQQQWEESSGSSNGNGSGSRRGIKEEGQLRGHCTQRYESDCEDTARTLYTPSAGSLTLSVTKTSHPVQIVLHSALRKRHIRRTMCSTQRYENATPTALRRLDGGG